MEKIEAFMDKFRDGELEMFISSALAAYKDSKPAMCLEMLRSAVSVLEGMEKEFNV